METYVDETGDVYVVSYYRAAPRDRRDRADWMMEREHLPSFEEAELLALSKPAWLDPTITRWSDAGPQNTYSRRADITPAGLDEIRQILMDHSNIAPVTDDICWAWADDVLDSLTAGNGARFEIDVTHSTTGAPQTFELSAGAWETYYEQD